jgi:hypothetical protein
VMHLKVLENEGWQSGSSSKTTYQASMRS